MLKRLRIQFTAITMVLLTVVLLLIFIFVYHFTRIGLENASMTALQTAGQDKRPMDLPAVTDPRNPCFVLERDPWGGLTAVGSGYYDLDDRQELEAILSEAMAAGTRSGVLEARALRFLRLEGMRGERYAFTDISSEQRTLKELVSTCIIIGAAALAGFFIISLLLARWMVRPVERAWEQQRQFVADASHELKTPLTVILTNAELLRSREYDAESKDRFAGSILTMSNQMRGLVEELLDQARVDNGTARMTMEKLDFSKLVSDAVLPFEPVYFEEGRGLWTELEPGIHLTGSGARLRQVVEILLDNGCKYSSPGGRVTLTLRRQGRSHCVLQVTSPGVPLTEEQCRNIFKRFYRVDAARSMNRSYGLGLSIAQGIVEQHKGKIWAQSRDGFNEFYVNLPL